MHEQAPLRVIPPSNVRIGPSIRVTESMRDVNLIYNYAYDSVICLSCLYVLPFPAERITGHLRRKHRISGNLENVIQDISELRNPAPTIVRFDESNQCVEGLPLYLDGRKCGSCIAHYFQGRDALIKHLKGLTHLNDDWELLLEQSTSIFTQTLLAKPNTKYFPVHISELGAVVAQVPDNIDITAAASRAFKSAWKCDEHDTGSVRVNSLVWKLLGIDTYLENIGKELVKDLVSSSISAEETAFFNILQRGCIRYIRKINSSIGRDWHNRNCISQGHSEPVINFKPFSPLQEDTTVESYGRVISQVILFYYRLSQLRNEHEGLELISSMIGQLYWDKIVDIHSTTLAHVLVIDKVVAEIHSLFYLMASTPIPKSFTRDSLFLFPYIAFKSYCYLRNLAPLSSELASAKYGIRGAVYWETVAHTMRQLSESHTNEEVSDSANQWLRDNSSILTNATFPREIKDMYNLLGSAFNTNIRLVSEIITLIRTQGRGESFPKVYVIDKYNLALSNGENASLQVLSQGMVRLMSSVRNRIINILNRCGIPELSVNGRESREWKDVKHNRSIGYSFLSDVSNGLETIMCQNTKKGLLRLQLANMSPPNAEGNDLIFNPFRCREFLRTTSEIVKELATLILWTCGNPPRTPEFLECTFRNTALSYRCLYIVQKTFVFVTEYVKYTNATFKEMPIMRFLPKDVSNLLLNYLVGIRPIELTIAKSLFNNHSKYIENYKSKIFVINGDLMLEQSYTDTFKAMNQRILRMNITVNLHRHMVDAYLKMHILEHRLSEELRVLDRQAGHSSYTAGYVYGRSDNDLLGIPTFLAVYFRNVSITWHGSFGTECFVQVLEQGCRERLKR